MDLRIRLNKNDWRHLGILHSFHNISYLERRYNDACFEFHGCRWAEVTPIEQARLLAFVEEDMCLDKDKYWRQE